MDRRTFLKRAGVASTGALLLPELVLADPYAPLPRSASRAAPVRVRGRVHAAGRGVGGAAVSDGLTVTVTDADGAFELITDARRRHVWLSLPSGYEVPVQPTGTARLHRPIAADTSGEMEAIFDLRPLETSDETHAFILLADPQTQNAHEVGRLHAETVPDLRATAGRIGERPLFGVACGDIMFDDLSLYPEYERAVTATGVPFFQVVGNHDLDFEGRTDEASTATFERHFGPPYFSFNRGHVHYVVLDDVFWSGADYLGYVSADQLTWLEADLALVERGSPVVVFLHIPLASTLWRRREQKQRPMGNAVANREALYRLLEPFRAHVLSGHTHESEHVFEGGVHEHVNGTGCGAWWSGPICYDGTPNGYGIYEVRDEELAWRYKATGLDAEQQLRVYPSGADPSAPAEVVANVWNWDPEWRVVWYEGADRRGAMTQRTGLDPLSVQLHAGPDLPERRKWVEPAPTDHLFYAEAAGDEIRVEVTDRFGRTYAAAPASPGSPETGPSA